MLSSPGEPLTGSLLVLSVCFPRVTQDVSTVWSGMRKESKYELEHVVGAGEGSGKVERRGLSFLFLDLRKRVDPGEKRLLLSATVFP